MICLFCPIKTCPNAGIIDGPGLCDAFPEELSDEELKTIAENMAELEEEDEQELLIERGICPHCGKPLR